MFLINSILTRDTVWFDSEEFNEDDEDWACNVDFIPVNKDLKVGQSETDWEQILEQVKRYIENCARTDNFGNSFLGKAEAIATGFDDGDLYLIKYIHNN